MTTVYVAALTFLIILAIGFLGWFRRWREDERPGMLPDDVYRSGALPPYQKVGGPPR